MNENKKGLIVVVVILAILVCLLGGYIVYDKVINNEAKTTEKDIDKVNNNDDSELEVKDEENDKKLAFLKNQNMIYEENISKNINGKKIELNIKYYLEGRNEYSSPRLIEVVICNGKVISGLHIYEGDVYFSEAIMYFDDSPKVNEIINFIKTNKNLAGQENDDLYVSALDLVSDKKLHLIAGQDKEYLAVEVGLIMDTVHYFHKVVIVNDNGKIIEEIEPDVCTIGHAVQMSLDSNYGSGNAKNLYYIKNNEIHVLDIKDCNDIKTEFGDDAKSCTLYEKILSFNNDKVIETSGKSFDKIEIGDGGC